MHLTMLLAQAAEQAPVVAKASPAIVNNFQAAVLAFKSGGWIVSLIGAAAMVGRLLVDEAADASWQRSLRHVVAAAIFAVIAYFVTFQWELSALNKAIVQGLCGAVAPELVDWLSMTIRKKLGFKDKKRTPAWQNLSRARRSPSAAGAPPRRKPPPSRPLPRSRPRRRRPRRRPRRRRRRSRAPRSRRRPSRTTAKPPLTFKITLHVRPA